MGNDRLGSNFDDVKGTVNSVEEKVNAVARYLGKRPLSVSRRGLYLIALLGTIGAIKSCDYSKEARDSLAKQPQLYTKNVVGNDTLDKFYIINGQRVFLEIDGKPIENGYFTQTIQAESPTSRPSEK